MLFKILTRGTRRISQEAEKNRISYDEFTKNEERNMNERLRRYETYKTNDNAPLAILGSDLHAIGVE